MISILRFLLLTLLLVPCILKAQLANDVNTMTQSQSMFTMSIDDNSVIIDSIIIEGNKITRDFIILRELDFAVGDTIKLDILMQLLSDAREQINNLLLFNDVILNIKTWEESNITVEIAVKERWYIWPIPIFELADRNFNTWWQDNNHRLDRTDYGLRFYQFNVRGRSEEFKLVVQGGFTQKFELFYVVPYFNNKLTKGVKVGISYSRNKQIAYGVEADKEVFISSDDYIRERFYTGITFLHRKNIHHRHWFDFEFHSNAIGDTIASLNKDYFLDSATTQRNFYVGYTLLRDYRDVISYPLEGSVAALEISKSGIGIYDDVNIYSVTAGYSRFVKVANRQYLAGKIKAKYSSPSKQPYFNQFGLGYGQDFIRGFENFVIDGQKYLILKSSYKIHILETRIEKSRFIPFKKFKTIPFDLYVKLHGDAGYVEDKFPYLYNELSNEWWVGYGFGIDLVTYYDMVFRMEYTFTNMATSGFFLHFKADLG